MPQAENLSTPGSLSESCRAALRLESQKGISKFTASNEHIAWPPPFDALLRMGNLASSRHRIERDRRYPFVAAHAVVGAEPIMAMPA